MLHITSVGNGQPFHEGQLRPLPAHSVPGDRQGGGPDAYTQCGFSLAVQGRGERVSFNDRMARDMVIRMYDAGRPEADIKAEAKRRFGRDDKTTRRCLRGLDLLRLGIVRLPDATRPHEHQTAIQAFLNQSGTDRYLKELARAADAVRSRSEAHRVDPAYHRGHIDNLFLFARLVRDALQPLSPHELAEGGAKIDCGELWRGVSPVMDPSELEEAGPKLGWGAAPRYDARANERFEPLRQHLADAFPDTLLAEAEDACRELHRAWEILWRKATEAFVERRTTSAEDEIAVLATSVAFKAIAGRAGPEFSYRKESMMDGGTLRWCLSIGAWNVVRDHSEDLDAMTTVHREISTQVTEWRETKAAIDGLAKEGDVHRRFQQALGPDDRLLQLLMQRRRGFCPD